MPPRDPLKKKPYFDTFLKEDLIAKYSCGDSLPALRRDFETMLDRFCEF